MKRSRAGATLFRLFFADAVGKPDARESTFPTASAKRMQANRGAWGAVVFSEGENRAATCRVGWGRCRATASRLRRSAKYGVADGAPACGLPVGKHVASVAWRARAVGRRCGVPWHSCGSSPFGDKKARGRSPARRQD